jgi:hypothetical protein
MLLMLCWPFLWEMVVDAWSRWWKICLLTNQLHRSWLFVCYRAWYCFPKDFCRFVLWCSCFADLFFCEKWMLTHDPDDGRFVCSLISSTEADYLCVTGHDIVSQRISAYCHRFICWSVDSYLSLLSFLDFCQEPVNYLGVYRLVGVTRVGAPCCCNSWARSVGSVSYFGLLVIGVCGRKHTRV